MFFLDSGLSSVTRFERAVSQSRTRENILLSLLSFPLCIRTLIKEYCMCNGTCLYPRQVRSKLKVSIHVRVHLWIGFFFELPRVIHVTDEIVCEQQPIRIQNLQKNLYRSKIRAACSCQNARRLLEQEIKIFFLCWDILLKRMNGNLTLFKIKNISIDLQLYSQPSPYVFLHTDFAFLSRVFHDEFMLTQEIEALPVRN
jgi:hypothetical protein